MFNDASKSSSLTPLLAAIVLTYNEEIHIGRCLRSIEQFCDEIYVVDSFSTDRTVAIAVAHGAKVLQNPFVNQSVQFQWALDHIETRAGWLFRIDADEVAEGDLADEVKTKLRTLPDEIVGVCLNRKHIFLGRWIAHGGRYPLYLLRIWRHGFGRVENKWMDEHIITWGGKVINFEGGFCDHNLKNISFFIEKHNQYATREAVDVFARRCGLPGFIDQGNEGLGVQAFRKRLLKQSFYEKLPFPVGPLIYFIYRYTVQLGFLDGLEGVIYHTLQGFWYRFLVGAKLFELEQAIHCYDEANKIRDDIERLTGLKLFC
ncbi:glycosyltransferase involved in cell wall biosynthesis [Rhodoblastus sphagnicola]|uniref:glycosyltransferase family 2 protein n=1 Tax=Rhodoblastus sphagnicola TaxID=333368 RepID=UPI001617D80D|nr:glycosyltransferase family 2 protein [Rhodoblastus sphagnicola]MBB4200544.1 glycosyltransferase involved in cell wall biosynthesis [Rhodoblastus sphagnicola]